MHPREMVRIWIALLHQEKPVHIVCWFFFFVCAMEGARTGRRRIAPQAISPVGCCLARGFQRVGMSTVEAVDRKISWLFCFVSHGCTVSARFLHGRCYVNQFCLAMPHEWYIIPLEDSGIDQLSVAMKQWTGSASACCGAKPWVNREPTSRIDSPESNQNAKCPLTVEIQLHRWAGVFCHSAVN